MTFKKNSTSENANGNEANRSRGSTDASQRKRSWDDLLDFWAEPGDEDLGNPPQEKSAIENKPAEVPEVEVPEIEAPSIVRANLNTEEFVLDDLENLLSQTPPDSPQFDSLSSDDRPSQDDRDEIAPPISNWTEKITKFQPSPPDRPDPPSLSDDEWPSLADVENPPPLFESLINPVERDVARDTEMPIERLLGVSEKEEPQISSPPASEPTPPVEQTRASELPQPDNPTMVHSSTNSPDMTAPSEPIISDLGLSPPLNFDKEALDQAASDREASEKEVNDRQSTEQKPSSANRKPPPPPPKAKTKAKDKTKDKAQADRQRQNGTDKGQVKRKTPSAIGYGLFKPRAEELDDPLKDLRDFLLAEPPKLETPEMPEEEDLDIPNLITFENSLKRLHELEQSAPSPAKSPDPKPPNPKSQPQAPSPKTQAPSPKTQAPSPKIQAPSPKIQPPTPKPKPEKLDLKPMLGELETVAKSLNEEEVMRLHGTIEELEDKLAALENRVDEPTEVINPLVPLMVQLLKMKVGVSQEAVMEVVVPIIDEVIQRRAQQNRSAMSSAIAELIPEAIAKEIQISPQEMAKALGPEMASAIREQIKVEKDSISKTLGPEMGRAIKQQIAVERDAMVDALYPVIGSTVGKYMGEVITTINDKVEKTLSPEGIIRKFRAKVQGVSEAELILQESMPITVQAIFLIHKTSGLVIAELQPALEHRLEANMLAGMLTAIRSFVNDCIAQSGEIVELNEIEYGDSRIIFEVAGYCYLAVAVKGDPSKRFVKKMRRTLSQIIQKYDREIEEFEGDSDTVPEAIPELLEKLIPTPASEKKKSPTALLSLLGAIVLFAVLPWAYFTVRGVLNDRLETDIEMALMDLETSAYSELSATARGKKVALHGRVPSLEIKEQAETMARGSQPKLNLEVDNQIVVVQVPPDPAWVAASIELVTSLLNRDRDIDITAAYTHPPGKVILRGSVTRLEDYSTIINTFQKLPGIYDVNRKQLLPEVLQKRIYFEEASSRLTSREISGTLVPIQRFLNQHPEVRLRIFGHADPTGQSEDNQVLSAERAATVKRELERRGIDPNRLIPEGIPESPPDVAAEQPLKWSRCVRFEFAFSDE